MEEFGGDIEEREQTPLCPVVSGLVQPPTFVVAMWVRVNSKYRRLVQALHLQACKLATFVYYNSTPHLSAYEIMSETKFPDFSES
jgi:hypothetical protein